mgnify:CR=1 FL=1
MKVLQVYKDYYPPVMGGIERHVNLLATGLRDRGIDVRVLVSNTRPVYEEAVVEGIRVIKAPQLFRLSSAPVNPGMTALLRRLGRDSDILHFHLPNPTADLAYLYSGLCGPKVIATYHSDIVRQKLLKTVYRPFFRRFLNKCHAIVTTSPHYLKSSADLCAYADKCHVVPLGINFARFDDRPGAETISAIRRRYGPHIVLFIGKFRYYKGLDVLLRAMENVDARLLMIGSGPYEARLKQLAAGSAAAGRIFFMGELADREVESFLKASDIFVLPSIFRSEAFGLAQLEAMACGKPVISTELGTGTSYVNQHGETGMVVPPGDHRALARSIHALLADPELRRQYGEAARRRARACFSDRQMIEKTLKIYKN